jgi:2-methylcitrate dehydratase PrpD
MHCGWAAHAGVSAVELVRQGFTGPPTVLEGRFGFFEAWLHGRYDPAAITDGLGDRWEVPGIFVKPYPANHFTHTGLDAARKLRDRGVDPARITKLVLGVPASVVRTIGEPIDVKRRPRTGYMAQFSGPYAVAVGLLGVGGLGDYTDQMAADPERMSIMDKVEVVTDAECTAIFPRQFPSRLTAFLDDGTEIVVPVLANRGGPAWPMTYEELAVKFADNAGRSLPSATVTDVQELVGRLDELPDLGPLLARLSEGDR